MNLRIVYIITLALCTLGSGFFSGSETALMSLGKERVHQLADRGRRGLRVQQLTGDPERLLSTLLVANNVVNILGTAIATALFIDLLGETSGPIVSAGVVTVVVLVAGEITPKTLAARSPERFSLAVAPTIYVLSKGLAPIAAFFTAITQGLLNMIGVGRRKDEGNVTEDDILALADLGHEEGGIATVEREIIDALFSIAEKPVRDVMTPRVDLATMASPVTAEQVRDSVSNTGHSRYLVTGDSVEDILGVLYVKDVLRFGDDATPDAIRRLLRQPLYIPESTPILEALQTLRSNRSGFAVISDEHGGIEGIITVKDLMAELVGELQDEHDPGTPSIVPLGSRKWIADGRVDVDDLAEITGAEIPEGQYSTMAGLFLDISGQIPEEGDRVTAGDELELVVLRMDRNRIDRLRVERI
ncbi:MAG: HlyC/CorC family transporter [Actinobacteria bacterium]|nr:HlyC/CorC family transporter [Actinomycetota bacterium]